MRLDLYLFENGYAMSRNKAAELIKDSRVYVNGQIITKTSFDFDVNQMDLHVQDSIQYVSRAAQKLKGFLDHFQNIKIEDKNCLDVGSSTGGFVQILLQKGALHVSCVDVGENQLHPSIRDNERLSVFEKTDIRSFQADKTFDVVTCDVSFISIKQILSYMIPLGHDLFVLLFKPQFEVGKDIKRNKKGVVQDAKAIERAMDSFEAECFASGLKLICKKLSTIKGKEGNEETFYCFTKR